MKIFFEKFWITHLHGANSLRNAEMVLSSRSSLSQFLAAAAASRSRKGRSWVAFRRRAAGDAFTARRCCNRRGSRRRKLTAAARGAQRGAGRCVASAGNLDARARAKRRRRRGAGQRGQWREAVQHDAVRAGSDPDVEARVEKQG